MPLKPTRMNARDGYPLEDARNNPIAHLRVLYNSFVKGLFAARQKGDYHWEAGEGSEIYITDETPVHTSKIGQRPAISFTRGPLQFYSLGQDDLMTYDFESSAKTRGVLVPGTMSINCCSREPLECEQIAWVVAEHLWILRDMLIGAGKFFEVGRQPQISAVSPAESIVMGDSAKEWWCTTVLSPFQFPRQSRATPLNQTILQHIELQLRAQLLTVQHLSTGGPAFSQNGVDVPVNVQTSANEAFCPGASDAHGGTPDPAGIFPAPPAKVAHPLDPTKLVVVRSVHPFRAGLRPPSMGGRTIPIEDTRVEESSTTPPFKTRV